MAPDIPDQEPDNDGIGQEPARASKGRPAFSAVLRPLTDDEMSASGVQKLLVAEIDRLEEENIELKAISRDFGDAQRKIGVLEEKLRFHTAFDVFTGGCITVGGVALGAIPGLSSVPPYDLVAAGLGIALIAVGFVSQVVKRR